MKGKPPVQNHVATMTTTSACLEVLVQRTTQENKGMRVCELLTSPYMPVGQWVVWEQVFKFSVGVFTGAKDKEPKRVRIWEQQVEIQQELFNPACRLNHFSEVRGAWVHFPPCASLTRDSSKEQRFCQTLTFLPSHFFSVPLGLKRSDTLSASRWGGWGGRVFIIAK